MSNQITVKVSGAPGRNGTYQGKSQASIARRLFGRDAYIVPGSYVPWANVYRPAKTMPGTRAQVATILPVKPRTVSFL